MKTRLTFVAYDRFDVNTDTGEVKIKEITLRFDPNTVKLNIDLLDALELAVKALRSGTVKPTFIQ